MQYGVHSLNFRKAVLVTGFFVLFEMCLLRPNAAHSPGAMADVEAAGKGGLSQVLGVIKEKRTGLGSIEELKLARVIQAESVRHGIDPLFVLALIQTESSYYNWSRSLNGALGLMQILPSTGRELAGEMNIDWNGDYTLLNPYLNVMMGIHYLSSLRGRFNDVRFTLAAYNAGPTDTAERMRQGEDVELGFAHRVLNNYKYLKEREQY